MSLKIRFRKASGSIAVLLAYVVVGTPAHAQCAAGAAYQQADAVKTASP